MRSLPILRACVRTCRYRLSRAATPTVSLSPTTGACVVACDIPAIVPARFTPCAGSSWGLGLCAQFATERLLRNVVDERLGAVDLHGGKQLAVPLLELGVAGDVHLAELERELRSKALQRGASTLAQVTARRVVEGDLRDRGRAWWSPRPRAGRRARTPRAASTSACSPWSPRFR